jgi:acetyl-CoA C-acetyltransferase
VDEVLHGLNPVAELIGWGQAGVDPAVMGVGPVEASRRALAMAGLDVADLDLYEANEAFAAQALAVAGELGLDDNRLNVNGGAIALGHPIGASGARIVVTLLHELARREAETGLATLCVGGGMGLATVYKRVELIMRPAAASHRPGTAGRPRAVPGVDADPKTPSR